MKRRSSSSLPTVLITPHCLYVTSEYKPDFPSKLRAAVGEMESYWHKDKRQWQIAPEKRAELLAFLERFYKIEPAIRYDTDLERIKDRYALDYIGNVKEGRNGYALALLASSDEWLVLFHQNTLKGYFTGKAAQSTPHTEQQKNQAQTLYDVLLVQPPVTDDEIKKAYRRMAMQWHPDRNKEAEASQMFMRAQRAYDALKTQSQRELYDLGLSLEKQLAPVLYTPQPARDTAALTGSKSDFSLYTPPLRCGIVEGKFRQWGGRIVCDEITKFSDIVQNGLTKVTYFYDLKLQVKWETL